MKNNVFTVVTRPESLPFTDTWRDNNCTFTIKVGEQEIRVVALLPWLADEIKANVVSLQDMLLIEGELAVHDDKEHILFIDSIEVVTKKTKHRNARIEMMINKVNDPHSYCEPDFVDIA